MMKEKRIRIVMLCCVLAAALSLSLLAAPLVTATENAELLAVKSGSCGLNLMWTLDNEGALTISGTGDMTEYDSNPTARPWGNTSTHPDIKSIVIDWGVTSISDYAFSSCQYAVSVSIPNTVDTIGTSAFADCKKLESVVIPDSVTHMYSRAFSGCSNLRSVTLSSSLTEIQEGMFNDCSQLVDIVIPENVTSIGSSTFWGCAVLKSIVIPKNVTSLGDCAFQSCGRLQSITLPSSLKRIGNGAFSGCGRLNNIFYEGSQEDWKEIAGSNQSPLSTNILHCNFPMDATRITLNQSKLVLEVNHTEMLTPSFYPEGTADEPLQWASSNSAIASVENGRILAKEAGNAIITAKTLDGRISASCALTVTAPGADGVFRINSVSVLDNNGAELSAVPTGPFLARVSVTNETSSESPLIFFAAYSAEGKYQDFMYAFVDASPGATVRVTLPVDNSAGNIAELKAFAVSSFSDLSIIGNPVSFPAT